jgi:hypothetical protein
MRQDHSFDDEPVSRCILNDAATPKAIGRWRLIVDWLGARRPLTLIAFACAIIAGVRYRAHLMRLIKRQNPTPILCRAREIHLVFHALGRNSPTASYDRSGMMASVHERVFRFLLRGIGVLLLSAAALIFLRVATIGPEHVGHEPPVVYCLALVGFACASAGAALFFYGCHLFDRVRVSELWASRLTMSEFARLQ